MLKSADYVRMAKESLGDAEMTDRKLGELLGGIAQPVISQARYGKMSDPLALRLASVLPNVHAGEILWVARMEREKDQAVKSALEDYVGKVLAAMPKSSVHSPAVDLAAVPFKQRRAKKPLCIM